MVLVTLHNLLSSPIAERLCYRSRQLPGNSEPSATIPESTIAAPEEPKAEEPNAEEPKGEESNVKETKAEEPKVEEPKVEEPKVEEPKPEEPKEDEPKAEATQNETVAEAAPETVTQFLPHDLAEHSNSNLYKCHMQSTPCWWRLCGGTKF